MSLVLTKRGVDIFAPQDGGGSARQVVNSEVQTWATEIESAFELSNNVFVRVNVIDTTGADPATDYEAGDTVDSVTLTAGDLVLRATSGGDADDGIYVVPASGAASRASTFKSYDAHPGMRVSVMRGAVHGDTTWHCTSNKGGTLGTTAIVFTQALLMGLGSASAPALAFAADQDTGIFRPTSNEIGLTAGAHYGARMTAAGTFQHFLTQAAGSRVEVQKISGGSALNYSGTTAASVVQSELLDDQGTNGTYPVGSIIYADKNCDGNVSLGSPDQSHSSFPVLRAAGINEGDGSMPAINTQVTLQAVGSVGYNEAALFSGQAFNAASTNGNISACEVLIGDSNDGGTTNFDTILTNFLARSKRYNAGSEACILYKWSIEGDKPADAVLKGLDGEIKTFADLRNQVITTGQILQLPNDVAFAAEDTGGTLREFLDVNSVNQTILRSIGGNASLRLQDGNAADVIEINNNKLGFFDATPVAKPTGVAVSAAGIHAALVSLGLIAA